MWRKEGLGWFWSHTQRCSGFIPDCSGIAWWFLEDPLVCWESNLGLLCTKPVPSCFSHLLWLWPIEQRSWFWSWSWSPRGCRFGALLSLMRPMDLPYWLLYADLVPPPGPTLVHVTQSLLWSHVAGVREVCGLLGVAGDIVV